MSNIYCVAKDYETHQKAGMNKTKKLYGLRMLVDNELRLVEEGYLIISSDGV